MGITKTDGFTEELNKLALVFKVLGHPARLAILKLLIQKDSCICGDIVDELPLAQATVSQHLKELKNAGLIKGQIEGASICYCINGGQWNLIKDAVIDFLGAYQSVKDCC